MTNDLSIVSDMVFDGVQWIGPSTIDISNGIISRVADARLEPGPAAKVLKTSITLPGLIDSAVSASGYDDTPQPDNPYAPEFAFAQMDLRYGVTTIVDINNSMGPLRFLSELAANGKGPDVFHSAGRLASRPVDRHDLVLTVDDVDAVLSWQGAAGSHLTSVGVASEQLRRRIGEVTTATGRPSVYLASPQDTTPGLWLMPNGGLPPQGPERAEDLDAGASYYVPQLYASAHWTIDGLLASSTAHLAAPVLPHCRHFVRNRGRASRFVSKSIMSKYYGDRDPSRIDAEASKRAQDFVAADRCIASSAAAQTGVVPGLSLWQELDALSDLLTDGDVVLRCATSIPAAAFKLGQVGRVEAGHRADLLLCSHSASRKPTDLLGHATCVLKGGVPNPIPGLVETVDRLLIESVRGA